MIKHVGKLQHRVHILWASAYFTSLTLTETQLQCAEL